MRGRPKDRRPSDLAEVESTFVTIPREGERHMATTTIKQRLFTQLLAQAENPAGAPEETLPVLEQFIYGLCRENATRDQADAAFAKLKDGFFDWNEVRVSTNREIEEVMDGLSDTETRAQRLIAFLQEVFETEFVFDLEVGWSELQLTGPST